MQLQRGCLLRHYTKSTRTPLPSCVDALMLTRSPSLRRYPALYSMRTRDVLALPHGRAALARHRDSLWALMCAEAPMMPWRPWLLAQLPRHLSTTSPLRSVLDEAALRLGITRMHDWHAVRVTQLDVLPAARALVQRFEGSLVAMLRALYPEHRWHARHFERAPRHSVTPDPGHSYAVHTQDDEESEYALLTRHVTRFVDMGAVSSTIRERYPQFRFPARPWDAHATQQWLDSLSRDLGVQRYADVVTLFLQDAPSEGGAAALAVARGGRGALARASQSPLALVRRVYPAYRFFPWHASQVPRAPTLRASVPDALALLHTLRTRLELRDMEDWERLSRTQLQRLGLLGAVDAHGGIKALLTFLPPDGISTPE